MTALPVFLTTGLLLNITPGPHMLYVLACASGQGRRAGLASALGIGAGCFVHISAVAFGLAGLLRTVPLAYNALRLCGAAYLIYLGVKTLLSHGAKGAQAAGDAPIGTARIFMQGAITNILNPKVALFFLAFLPQFIDPAGSAFAQTVKLGLLFDCSGTMVNIAVALAAGHVGGILRRRSATASVFKRLTGAVFIGLGLRLARQTA